MKTSPVYWTVASVAVAALLGTMTTAASAQQVLSSDKILAEASSFLKGGYGISWDPVHVLDDMPHTAWAEGVDGPGVGEFIRLKFDDPVVLHRLSIRNGVEEGEAYHRYGRVKSALVILNGHDTQYDIQLADHWAWQEFDFPPTLTDGLTLYIREVWPGSRFEDTCLSEIHVTVE